MGYYTHYELETSDGVAGEHMDAIATLAMYANLFEEAVKWYDHEDQMIEYSKKHPTVVFYLTGDGEESLDIWAKWFKNGEVQRWRLVLTMPGIDDPPYPWPSETPGASSAG